MEMKLTWSIALCLLVLAIGTQDVLGRPGRRPGGPLRRGHHGHGPPPPACRATYTGSTVAGCDGTCVEDIHFGEPQCVERVPRPDEGSWDMDVTHVCNKSRECETNATCPTNYICHKRESDATGRCRPNDCPSGSSSVCPSGFECVSDHRGKKCKPASTPTCQQAVDAICTANPTTCKPKGGPGHGGHIHPRP